MEQTLLLNATYEPLKVVHWQKAITLWCQGKVEIIAHHDREVRAVSFSFKMPSVIRLLRYVRIKQRFDYPRLLGPEVGAQVSPDLRTFLGYAKQVPESVEQFYENGEKAKYTLNTGQYV